MAELARPQLHASRSPSTDTLYQIIERPRRYFKKGRCFMVIWSEPAGSSSTSRLRYNGTFTKGRRFLVIRSKPGHCLCLAVHTYEGRATSKKGVIPDDHAPLIPVGGSVALHPFERPLKRETIHIVIENHDVEIDSISRIDFSRVYTIEYNLPVRNIGRISPEDLTKFEAYFNEEMNLPELEMGTCLQALRVTDPRADKDRIIASKDSLLEKPSEWIFQDPNFQKWRDTNTSLLWIQGAPGKGKTMLMIALIEELSRQLKPIEQENGKRKRSDLTGTLSYFMCQAADARLNSAVAVLRGLMYLLILQHPSLETLLQEEYGAAGSDLFDGRNAFFELRRILLTMLESNGLGRVYLLVDGLDECLSGLSDLLALIGAARRNVKWIVSSRNQPDIEAKLKPQRDCLRLSLEINRSHVSLAVDAFINSRLQDLPHLHNNDYELKETLADRLREKAEGTFLWVSLALKALQYAEPWEMESTLQTIPPSLGALYKRMITQIENHESSRLCKQILLVATLGFRPMHLRELEVSVDFPENFSGKWMPQLVNLCGSFLTVRDEIVYFVHQSARDYLRTGAGSKSLPNQKEYHGKLASRLVDRMSHILKMDICDLKSPGTLLRETEHDFHEIIHVRYASRYWVDHLLETDRRDQYLIDQGIVHKFLLHSIIYWFEVLSLMGEVQQAVLMVAHLQRLTESSKSPELSSLIYDAYRFILKNSHILEQAPLQIYCSSLTFSPRKSIVRKQNYHLIPHWFTQMPAIDEQWGPLLMTLEGHSNGVRAMTFSPDGRQVASGSDDGTVRLWDAGTGTVVQALKGHYSCVRAVAFSLDGRRLASGSDDGTIRLWNAKTGAVLQRFETNSSLLQAVDFLPEGRRMALGSDNSPIRLWDTATGAIVAIMGGHSLSVSALADTSDGLQLAAGSDDCTIQLWDMKTCAVVATLIGHSALISAMAFSPDGKLLASASNDHTFRLWDVKRGSLVETLGCNSHTVHSVAFSRDGRQLVTGSDDGTVRLWDVATGAMVATLDGHLDLVQAVAFSPNGQQLVSGSADRTIRLWDVDKAVAAKPKGHSESISAVAFSPDGRLLASGSPDHTVRLWDIKTQALMTTLDDDSAWVYPKCLSTDGRQLSIGSASAMRLSDVKKAVVEATVDGHSSSAYKIAFSSDGRRLILEHGETAIWELETAFMSPLFANIDAQHERSGLEIGSDVYPDCGHAIHVKDAWVAVGNRNFLWLAPEYRPFKMATKDNILAIVSGTGEIFLFQFELSQIPL